MRPRVEDHPAHRRLPAIAAFGVLALLTVTGCWGKGGSTPSAEPPPSKPPAASPSAPGSPPAPATPRPTAPAPRPTSTGTWRVLPPAPVYGGPNYASVWTGTELIIHRFVGDIPGPPQLVDVAYNPTTNRWRELPAALYLAHWHSGSMRAMWTGTEMITFGRSNAAYNPRTNRWRLVAAGPAGPSVAVWTGRQVLTWGGGCCDGGSAEGWAYDPPSDTWRKLPPAPLSGRYAQGVWTGREMVVIGGRRDGVPLTDGAAYNPATRTWRKIPLLPAPRLGATLTWTGSEVLMVGGHASNDEPLRIYQDGLGYNPATNRWRRLPDMTIPRAFHVAVWTGRQLLVWGGAATPYYGPDPSPPPYGVAYTPATNRWSALPKAPLRGRTDMAAAWTGREMLVWGGSYGDLPLRDGAAYRPPAAF